MENTENKTPETTLSTNVQTLSFKNPELNRVTLEIIQTLKDEVNTTLKRAVLFSEVKEKKLYKDDGFKNFEDYTQAICPEWSRSYSYKMAAVGLKMTGKKLLLTDGTEASFSSGQYDAMAKLSADEIQSLINEGRIGPETSVRKLKEVADEIHPTEEKPTKEKVYLWASINKGESSAVEEKGTTSEIKAALIKSGCEWAETLKANEETYMCAILKGTPIMFHRLEEVKPEKADNNKKKSTKK